MTNIQILLRCILGPRFYRFYKINDLPSKDYIPNTSEVLSDNFIKLCSLSWNISFYTWPIILYYFQKRNDLNQIYLIEYSDLMIKSIGLLCFSVGGAFFVRGLSRYQNPDYREFIEKLSFISKLSQEQLKENNGLLNKYDFDFNYWPIAFKWEESNLSDLKKPPQVLSKKKNLTFVTQIKNLPVKILSYLAIKLFGRQMIYPGSVGLVYKIMEPIIKSGRTRIVEGFKGKRFKLQTLDKNSIDTIFVDNRNKTLNGNKLVICCDGNAGFYEIGIFAIPIEMGYSALGWNHPGFGGSTGIPYPKQEINAIDTVIKFAINNLGYKIEDIIIYAWSIGGYTATWAAMHYPNIKGLILDATFDDLTELAISKMPIILKPVVIDAISTYFNLNISEQLNYYKGPLILIRRTKDEIINTNDEEPLKTNRANDIIVKLLKNRFPNLMQDEAVEKTLIKYLRNELSYNYSVDNNQALFQLKNFAEKEGKDYPFLIGNHLEQKDKINLILYLTKKILIDYDATHCLSLDISYFQEPTDILSFASIHSQL